MLRLPTTSAPVGKFCERREPTCEVLTLGDLSWSLGLPELECHPRNTTLFWRNPGAFLVPNNVYGLLSQVRKFLVTSDTFRSLTPGIQLDSVLVDFAPQPLRSGLSAPCSATSNALWLPLGVSAASLGLGPPGGSRAWLPRHFFLRAPCPSPSELTSVPNSDSHALSKHSSSSHHSDSLISAFDHRLL